MERRRFLSGAAAAVAGGALVLPRAARAQVIRLTFQAAWAREDLFYELAADYARTVREMSGGLLELDLVPAGEIAGALELHDAIASGAVDAGHLVTAYGVTRNKAYSLFGTPPSFGWDANTFLGWVKYGGGQELYEELLRDVVKLDLIGFLTGPLPSQPLGWFNQEIRSPADLRGLRYRTAGLAAELMAELGAEVILTGSAEIVPAFRRGLLDAAEFNNPSSDRALGFPEVARIYMLRSYHQMCECLEILFNRARFQSLPEDRSAA
ncbi:MAG: C4-dicarboxylate ABC transporter [Pseudomonadota bacterium]|nr:C4-dicarboxylate ABC transporter [Pseudomonadota bacterium]